MGVSRRDVLKLVPGAAAATWAVQGDLGAQTPAPYPPALGVQLYTLRDHLGPKADATIKAVADIGYREVETTADALETVAPLLKKYGLTAPSGHFGYDAIASPEPGEAFTRSVSQARDLGMRYYVVAYLMPDQRKTPDDYRRIADRLNDAARRVKDAGLQFAYHHHSFEFEPLSAGGKTERGWDIFLSQLDKELVALEVDVFWLAMAGLDPAKTILDLGSRVKLLHLKDRAKDAADTFNEGKVPAGAFKEVGNGGLDFAAILKAAREVGAQGLFVEQDQTAGDPLVSLRQSFQYLRSLKT